ncbi:hypothetical protein [Azohydromonas lata]|uniref:hypothetical protein n=1 Tax=Azohydromonas lata TaxID=45677 RepID=UPI00082F8994|nr:hypothetical protein [Azohydromonas lata]
MAAPPPICHQTLTGRVRPRRTWLGRVVLQVEVLCERLSPPVPPMPGELHAPEQRVISTHTEWRDARMNDPLAHVYRSDPERRSLA